MRETIIESNEKGITLVALVVTIIVLMILAGITLTLVLGQNGIITKAKQAKEASANADKATAEGLNNLDQETEDEIKGIVSPVGEYKDNGKIISLSSNTAIKDDEGNTVTIPAGFKIANDSTTRQEDGIVIEDKDGNQFVWIPVAGISNYARKDFGKYWGSYNYSNYSETMPSDEQTSVNTYHGYYIGRYEAGDRESTNNKVMRSSQIVTDTVAIKKGQAPYNYVTRDQAITLSTGMKTVENYNAETKLCSSYAWDTAVNFIQNRVTNYSTTSPKGNYNDTTVSYIDITGASQTKTLSSSILIPTGETVPECNIYDMGGNDWDWTTEACDDTKNAPYVIRGGCYGDDYLSSPAGCRNSGSSACAPFVGFRVTLYM